MSHKYPLLGTLLIALLLTSLLAQAPVLGGPAAAAQSRERGTVSPATPALIERAYAAGTISADQRLLYLAYALYDSAALPAQFRSRTGWYGTRYAREVGQELLARPAAGNARPAALQAEADRLGRLAGTVCEEGDGTTTDQSANFFLNYTSIGGGLTAAQYLAALETSFDVEVTSYGWAKPPYTANNTNQKYPVQAAGLGNGLFGYVTSGGGSYTGAIGDNPNTAATETAAFASCMVLNDDYSSFGNASAALVETAAHEFAHSIQYGYGDPGAEEDAMWFESPASYVEDEVFDDSNGNYYFLWPNFRSCLGNWTDNVYVNWPFFRYAAERYGGTNVAGGGEDIIEKFMVNVGAGQPALTAYQGALEAKDKDATLADTFHNYAIAVRFNKACPEGTPNCFEEGPGYADASGANTNHGAIAAIGGSYSGTILNHYALAWIGLPATGSYSITLRNTSAGGEFRASIVADLGDGLEVTPLPSLVGGNGEASLAAYTPPAEAKSVVAVITNQQQVSANPSSCSANPFTLQTAAVVTVEERLIYIPLVRR